MLVTKEMAGEGSLSGKSFDVLCGSAKLFDVVLCKPGRVEIFHTKQATTISLWTRPCSTWHIFSQQRSQNPQCAPWPPSRP